MAVLGITQGETFNSAAALTIAGVTDFSAYTITSQVRQGTWWDSLTVTLEDPDGTLTLAKTDTSGWPTGIIGCDVKAVAPDGVVTITKPFHIEVKKAYTK